MIELYFSPLACSLASRIALYEAGADARFIRVDGKTKRTDTGQSFIEVTSLGLVPTLLDGDERVLENAAVLQYVARRFPAAELAPRDEHGTAQLQQWLCFIGTELHKAIFAPLLDKTAHEEVKAYALRKVESRFGWLEQHLTGRTYLLDAFSIADAYLFAVLNWSLVTPIELKHWPAVHTYHERLNTRPTVARAFAEELALYRRELEAITQAS